MTRGYVNTCYMWHVDIVTRGYVTRWEQLLTRGYVTRGYVTRVRYVTRGICRSSWIWWPRGELEQTLNSRKRIYFVQLLVDGFWKGRVSSYLPSLLEGKKWHHLKRNLQTGDMVIIQDTKLHRIDGKVRRVKVKCVNSSGDLMVVSRPVQRLVVDMWQLANWRRNQL